jgi:hypothetical protein
MADVGDLIPFPNYSPDLAPIGQSVSQAIFNVLPKSDGYGPALSLQTFTSALPSACRGYFFGRKTDGSIAIFAGTATDLYLLNNTTFAWVLVSKGNVTNAYASIPSTDNWSFGQFNDLVIACQANTTPQKFILSSASNFIDLGGTPPFAAAIAVIGFFVVLSSLTSNQRRVQWSDLDLPEQWTAGVGLSDFQDFPDGGSCQTVTGGDAFGMIFQEQSVRSMTYMPGSAAIFQFYRMSTQEALYGKYSVINIGNRVLFCGAAGFKMVVAGSDAQFIGKEIVDKTFFADVDPANPQLIIGASDPTSTRVFWAYKSISGQTALFDRILIYDFVLNKWARLNVTGEYIASLAKPGLTLEGLDSIAPQQLLVTGAVVSPTNPPLIRLTLTATSNSYFNIAGQNTIVVQGVQGTVEANGTWKPNIIDATHIELVGSVFVHTYTSGGAIGGSLDALTFSLDSVAKSSTTSLSSFNSLNQLGFFNGPTLEAVMETGDADGKGQFIFTNAVMPITDATQVYCSIGYRNSPQGAVLYTAESAIDDQGQAPLDIESRYQRVHVRIVAGTAWSFARGAQTDSQLGGER